MEKTAELRRRRLACAVLAGALALAAGGALAQAKKPAAQRAPMVLAINEGATTQVTPEELFERYTGLARSIERAIGRPVKLEVYPDTARFRAELERRRFDVVFGKTVNLLAGMIRDKQFQAVVKTKAPYVAGFITRKGSPITKAADMRGKVIMMPEKVFTTKLGEATLRDLGFKEGDVTIRYTRFQEAVALSVESGAADVGVVNPTVKKDWVQKGNTVLLEAKPVPNWSIITAPTVAKARVERLRGALIGLAGSDDGAGVLKAIAVPEFVAADNAEYLELLKFIGE